MIKCSNSINYGGYSKYCGEEHYGSIVVCRDCERAFQQKQIDLLEKTVAFYGDKENWTRRESMFWENIDRNDCSYSDHTPHLRGGKRARECQEELRKMRGEE